MRRHHLAAGTVRGRLTPAADLVRLSNSIARELSALPTRGT
jgi:hypothetical protein